MLRLCQVVFFRQDTNWQEIALLIFMIAEYKIKKKPLCRIKFFLS